MCGAPMDGNSFTGQMDRNMYKETIRARTDPPRLPKLDATNNKIGLNLLIPPANHNRETSCTN